jgi:anthranilate phosphoribosyltransferase
MPIKYCLEKLIAQQPLEKAVCQQALEAMLADDSNPIQTAAFLVLLHAKQETTEELTAMVCALQKAMIPVLLDEEVLAIVGTGGDRAHTVNISTASAILAASCGVKIAKHGNRAVSSKAGSADLLEALGIRIDLSPQHIAHSIHTIGIGFCYSPNFHPLLAKLRPIRNSLKIPTSFNLLGPLLNPAKPQHLLLGVYQPQLMPVMAQTVQALGTKRSLIVHGAGIDELSPLGPATIMEVTATTITQASLEPSFFGFKKACLKQLQGDDAKANAAIILHVLAGHAGPDHAIADSLILNAAAALYLSGHFASIYQAIELAKDHLYSGKALQLLKAWREFSHDHP